jgi:glutaredoxin 3
MGAKYFTIELDQVGTYNTMRKRHPRSDSVKDDGADIQAALREINGQSSVPNIYIGQKHIGGNSDLQARKSQLPSLLKEVHAI